MMDDTTEILSCVEHNDMNARSENLPAFHCGTGVTVGTKKVRRRGGACRIVLI